MVKFLDKSKVDFIVKENEGIVVAKFSEPETLTCRILQLINNEDAGFKAFWKDAAMILDRVSTVRGVAKCAPEDTFDVKTGKRIALSHLRFKTIRSISKLISRHIEKIHKEHNRLLAMFDDGMNFLDIENDRLKKIYGSIDN